ncbi:hypothetical protein L2K70_16300 [Nocardioides KLBMP 9356]|uniref:Big-1 domain-containing protein n=1 Tax=Nocardioides potassii TaxID=2911371 RepID=A0ABS9HG16_9ACTN|nr:hypothetical protein [Nocardioides potassii]MCF6379175.1 hypothetical protein [Nocardioides potassii]
MVIEDADHVWSSDSPGPTRAARVGPQATALLRTRVPMPIGRDMSNGRRTVPAVLGALGIGVASVVAVTVALPRLDLAPACGPHAELVVIDGVTACTHLDIAPPGVDIDEPASTAELHGRDGVGANAVAAAEDLGVPAPETTAATTPDVVCDGDGVSGYRTQAMYVVEAGATNRYEQVKGDIQRWAAGVDDVFNRSAALTGGVRHVRYVTEPGGGGCVVQLLNVTVPTGSMTSFNATMDAVRALGYDRPERKYLMWTDTSGKGICGIALRYTSDADGQGNPNNGLYPQYSRIDNPCWGFGDGASQHSVEAHELLHTMGGVSPAAPHGTSMSHCFDESDTMCYADGSGRAMQQVCDPSREYLLDCNFDDYYSTYPDPGSWLDTHWNSADSRFLIGGGANGQPGTPTVLGAALGVNNPAVPGLATQASVAPAVPEGRTLTSVSWRAGKADCTFSDPTSIQTDVTCSAASSTATTVTATLVDSSGAQKVVSSPLTFSTAPRTVGVRSMIAGQPATTSPTATACTSAPTPVQAYFYDTATSLPVKGLAAAITKTVGTTSTALTATSDASGNATATVTMPVATAFSMTNKALPVWPVTAPVAQNATVATCTVALQAAVDVTSPWYGDPVTVTGRATRQVGGLVIGVAGLSVPVSVVSTSVVNGSTVTKVTSLGTARTNADGTFTFVAKPTVSGVVRLEVTASTSYDRTRLDVGTVTVRIPASSMTASVDQTALAYGQTAAVTGQLLKDTGSPTPVPGATISVKVTAPGKAPVQVASGRTGTDGRFTVPAVLTTSGELTVSYAGTAGVPAASRSLGTVAVGTWTTALSAPVATPGVGAAGTARTITGTVTRSYADVTEPARSIRLSVLVQPVGGTMTSISTTTTSTGTYSLKVYPQVTTTYTVRVLRVAGHSDATAAPVTLTVG